MIRRATVQDAESIAKIYNHYIKNTIITFEETPVTADDMARRIETIQKSHVWLVSEKDRAIQGYAYVGPFHGRCAYRFTVEMSIYLHAQCCGQGLGSRLMTELFSLLDPSSIHTIMGAIALPNEPSVRLHEKFGFKKVGHFDQVGFKFNRWIDVGFWEKHYYESASEPVQGRTS